MTETEITALISRCRVGDGDCLDMMTLAEELDIYRAMALRLEKVVHDLIKDTKCKK